MGNSQSAVNSFIHHQARTLEVKDALGSWQGFKALSRYGIDVLQEWVFGYGRSIVAPIGWAAAFIGFGWFLFRRESSMERVREDAVTSYSGFWYSLELFLPIVDLGIAKGWRPKASLRHLQTYARVHQLAGWILVPVMVGIITGSLR